MIKLIAVDVDDTLVGDDLTISQKNKDAVRQVLERGVFLTLATGRMHVSALPYALELELPADRPLISYNGAMLRRIDGELLHHQGLDVPIALEAAALCRARGWTLNAYFADTLYVERMDPNVEYYVHMARVPAVVVGDLSAFISDGEKTVSKLLIVGTAEETVDRIGLVQEVFGERAQVVQSKPRYIELTHPQANKGLALQRLAKLLGVAREEVLAIGDSGNDVPMLKYAGIGAAMGGGRANAKEAADYVAPPSGEDGVADVLHRFVLSGQSLQCEGP